MSVRLEAYPKAVIDLYALVLQHDGSPLAAAISCASMALADAGIEMNDLVAACSAAKVGTHLLLDPALAEERRRSGGVLVAYMPSLDEVTQLLLTGELDSDSARLAIRLCLDGCSELYRIMRLNLIQTSARAAASPQQPQQQQARI